MTASVPQVTTLANGMRVVADPMPHLESLALGVWVETGSRHEIRARMGVSHMLEHMAFKGTERRTARQINEEIEAVGGYLNAYTSAFETAYYARLLRDDLALGIDLLADILRRPTFDPAELERERGVILQEIARANDTPDDVVFDRLQAAAYPDQPMGWPILGTAETVGALTRDDLADHMSVHYGPDRIIIGAAGAIDPDRLFALVTDAFGDWPVAQPYPEIMPARFGGGPSYSEERSEQLHLALGFEGVGEIDPAIWTAELYTEVLGGGASSRLYQSVREEHGLAYSVYASLSAYPDGGTHTIYAGTGPEQGARLLALVAEEVRRMADAVSEAELGRARASLRSGLLMGRERPMARLETAIGDLFREGRVVEAGEKLAHYDAVTPQAVSAYAARLLDGPKPALGAVGPAPSLPDYDRLVAALTG